MTLIFSAHNFRVIIGILLVFGFDFKLGLVLGLGCSWYILLRYGYRWPYNICELTSHLYCHHMWQCGFCPTFKIYKPSSSFGSFQVKSGCKKWRWIGKKRISWISLNSLLLGIHRHFFSTRDYVIQHYVKLNICFNINTQLFSFIF